MSLFAPIVIFMIVLCPVLIPLLITAAHAVIRWRPSYPRVRTAVRPQRLALGHAD